MSDLTKNKFTIVVLDDNAFYSAILSKRIKTYAKMLSFAFNKNYEFDIKSYTTAIDCIKNLKRDTDIFFIDFFLDNKIKASDLFGKIRKMCNHCKVVVISNTRNIGILLRLFPEEAITFIYKDEDALSKSCMIIDEVVTSRN